MSRDRAIHFRCPFLLLQGMVWHGMALSPPSPSFQGISCVRESSVLRCQGRGRRALDAFCLCAINFGCNIQLLPDKALQWSQKFPPMQWTGNPLLWHRQRSDERETVSLVKRRMGCRMEAVMEDGGFCEPLPSASHCSCICQGQNKGKFPPLQAFFFFLLFIKKYRDSLKGLYVVVRILPCMGPAWLEIQAF